MRAVFHYLLKAVLNVLTLTQPHHSVLSFCVLPGITPIIAVVVKPAPWQRVSAGAFCIHQGLGCHSERVFTLSLLPCNHHKHQV